MSAMLLYYAATVHKPHHPMSLGDMAVTCLLAFCIVFGMNAFLAWRERR